MPWLARIPGAKRTSLVRLARKFEVEAVHLFDIVLRGDAKRGSLPELWDGHAGDRIARAVVELCRTPGE